MRRPALLLVSAALVAVAIVVPAAAAPAQVAPTVSPAVVLPGPTTGNHFVTNLHGEVQAPRSVGFTIFDTGASVEQIAALPQGIRALVWLGQKCPTPADAAFRATVQRLATNPKVFGYYLSDEPHVADCPGGATALASRASFVRAASAGTQVSFIVLSRVEDYVAFRPTVSRVSLVGLDPYPCSVAHPTCAPSLIDEKVNAAVASFARSRIVPVYQAFGQSATASPYYNLPTTAQMSTMLARWTALVPSPAMDYTYGWGHQGSSNPTLIDSAALQGVLRSYFAS
ncbi:MAG TPA: hypothetical protein VFQ11_09345 [Nocardioidaceae bacterium]|nr:hypothetical protein [Nocardioidaceae bacterium]